MATLSEHLEDVLVAITTAYEQRLHDGGREPLIVFTFQQGPAQVAHHAWPEDAPALDLGDIEQLEELGQVRVQHNRGTISVAPTHDAIEAIADYKRALALLDRDEEVDLDWRRVRGVLHAVMAVWQSMNAPVSGGPSNARLAEHLEVLPDDLFLLRAVEQLAAAEWVIARFEGDEYVVIPTTKAVSGVLGWPGGGDDAALERLLAGIDEFAASVPEDEQPKFRRAREFFVDLGAKATAELAARAAGVA